MLPLISVLIPVYNTEAYLTECLDSVVGQTYEHLDIVLVDDGSTDASAALCDQYAARDGRVRVFHQPNGGVAAARNRLLALARGELIAWVDSDDVCAPDMLAYLYQGLTDCGADIAQCEVLIDQQPRPCPPQQTDCRVVEREEMESIYMDGTLWHPVTAKLMRRVLFDGLPFQDLVAGEDTCLFYDMIDRLNRFVLLKTPKYDYRTHGDSITHTISMITFTEAFQHMLPGLSDRPKLRGYILYSRALQLGVTLSREKTAYRDNRRFADDILAQLPYDLPAIRASGCVGRLGRLELLALGTGRPWSWHFCALCQRYFEFRGKRRNGK